MLILKKHIVNQATGVQKNDNVGILVLDPEEILTVCEESFRLFEQESLTGFKDNSSQDDVLSIEVEVAKYETSNCLKIHSYDPRNFIVSILENDNELLAQKNYAPRELALILEEYYLRDNEHFMQYLPQVPTIPKGEQQRYVEKVKMDTVTQAKEIVKQVDKLRSSVEVPKQDKREPKLIEIIILIAVMVGATVLAKV